MPQAYFSPPHPPKIYICNSQAAGPSTEPAAPARAPSSKSRYQSRLEELEVAASASGAGASSGGGGGGSGGGGKVKNVAGVGMAGGLLLTAEEYTAHVRELRVELEEAWSKEEKVAALKVTVQVRCEVVCRAFAVLCFCCVCVLCYYVFDVLWAGLSKVCVTITL